MGRRVKIYFVGAGPGDPELLTLKAAKIIKQVDIIIYAGSLVNSDILSCCKKDAQIYDSSTMNLEQIIDVFRKAAADEKTIARINSGDVSIYSAIQEQADWCEENKIDYEVIPGISSYQAAAATLKQEFTLPKVSQTVVLTRISGRTKVPSKEDLESLAKARPTMIIFLSIDKISRVIEKLKNSYGLNTPVVVIERVTLAGERKIIGTIKDIVKKVKDAGVKRQALIIVGDVLKKKYEKSRLYDKNFEHGFRGKDNSRRSNK